MELNVQSRAQFGNNNKELRKKWLIPWVVYGKHMKQTTQVVFAKNEFLKLYKKAWTSSVVDLSGDHKEMVLIYDIQIDGVTNNLLHVDFLAVKADQLVTAEVNVIMTGESPLVKSWEGRIDLLRSTIAVTALPKDLPHEITLDISNINTLEDGIFIRDIDLWSKVKIEEDMNQVVIAAVEIDSWDEPTPEPIAAAVV